MGRFRVGISDGRWRAVRVLASVALVAVSLAGPAPVGAEETLPPAPVIDVPEDPTVVAPPATTTVPATQDPPPVVTVAAVPAPPAGPAAAPPTPTTTPAPVAAPLVAAAPAATGSDPRFQIDKTVYEGHDGGAGCPGVDNIVHRFDPQVTYCFKVTNVGDSDIENITLDDPAIGITDTDMTVISGNLAFLEPGQVALLYYEFTGRDYLLNAVSMTGFAAGGGPRLGAADVAEIGEIETPTGGITLSKTVYEGGDAGASCPGGEAVENLVGTAIVYCFVVTNSGNVPLENVTVFDPTLGVDESDMTVVSGSLASIAADASVTLAFASTITTDLVNTATAEGTPLIDGSPDEPVSDSDDATVRAKTPPSEIALDKSVYSGHSSGAGCSGGEYAEGAAGTAITYCFKVTNRSRNQLIDIRLDDPSLGIDHSDMTVLSGSLDAVSSGESVFLFYETTIAGSLVNTASASGQPAADSEPLPVDPISVTDTAEVRQLEPPGADFTFSKTVYQGHDSGASCEGTDLVEAAAGTAITYCFTLSNPKGGADLANVLVDDPDLGIDQSDMTIIEGSLASVPSNTTLVLAYETTLTATLLNTATVAAEPLVDGKPQKPVSKSDTAQVTIGDGGSQDAAIDLDKRVYSGHDDGASCPGFESVPAITGGPITYCFVITNTGDVDLFDLTVDDLDLGIDETDLTLLSGSLTSLAPGASITLFHQASATLTTNTATAGGTPPETKEDPAPEPVTDTDSTGIEIITPDINLRKSVYRGHDSGASCRGGGGEYLAGLDGDAVTYCFTVTNPAPLSRTNPGFVLTQVTVDDPDLGIDQDDMTLQSGDLALLDRGGAATLFYETTMEEDLLNTATVTAVPIALDQELPEVEDSDTAEVDVVAPDIAIDKTVYRGHTDGSGCDGGELATDTNDSPITYCFTVTNTGDTILAPVTIDDAALGIEDINMNLLSGDLSSLDPGDSATLYFETTITGDLVNTATAYGTPGDDNGDPLGLDDVTDDDTARVDLVAAGITLSKTVYEGHDDGAGCEGDELVTGLVDTAVTYCFVVTNTGGTDAFVGTVVDPDLGINQSQMTVLSGSLSPMAPGATATLYYETAIADDLLNTAQARGEARSGSGFVAVGDTDTAAVDALHPDVLIGKSVYRGHDSGAGCPGGESAIGVSGDALTYCFGVINTGDTALDIESITDPALGIDASDMTVISGDATRLEAGASASLYYETTLAGDLTNTATVMADPDAVVDLDPISDSDTATVDVVAPAITLAKTVYAGHDSGAGCPGAELVTGPDATAVTYCFVGQNTGDTTLTDVTVSDPDLGIDQSDMTLLFGDLASVAPGAFIALSYEASISGDLVNTATVTGTPTVGRTFTGSPVSDTDTAAVVVDTPDPQPAVEIAKTVYPGHDGGAGCPGSESAIGVSGDALTYCFGVINTGDTAFDIESLSDPALGIDLADMTVRSGNANRLEPGQAVSLYYETTMASDIVNTATVVADPDGVDDDLTDSDTATVDVVAPDIDLAKTVYTGHDGAAGCPGADLVTSPIDTPLTYCFTVTNTGDTTLANVAIDDPDLGIDQDDMTVVAGALASLTAGQSATLAYETLLTADLVNTATATGTPTVGRTFTGAPVSDTDTASVVVDVPTPQPAVEISKTVYAGHDTGAGCQGSELVTGAAGAPVTYCFVVTNTGDATLTSVTVTDDDLGIDQDDMVLASDVLSPLEAGASATLYFETTINGDLVNTAVASATPAGGVGLTGLAERGVVPPADVTDSDTAEVTETGVADLPDLTITKSVATTGAVEPGDEVTWILQASNPSNFDAPGLMTVSDDLPDGLEFVSVSGDGWTCAHDAGLVTCERAGGLTAQTEAPPITLVTRIAEDATAAGITNVASVASESTETTTTNNDADADVLVRNEDTPGDPGDDDLDNPTTPSGGALPRTGATTTLLVALALALLSAGVILTTLGRRPTST